MDQQDVLLRALGFPVLLFARLAELLDGQVLVSDGRAIAREGVAKHSGLNECDSSGQHLLQVVSQQSEDGPLRLHNEEGYIGIY